MHWGPLKSSDRGMGPRGHGKCAWGGGGESGGAGGHALGPFKVI